MLMMGAAERSRGWQQSLRQGDPLLYLTVRGLYTFATFGLDGTLHRQWKARG